MQSTNRFEFIAPDDSESPVSETTFSPFVLQQQARRTCLEYFDSFDWLLFRKGYRLEYSPEECLARLISAEGREISVQSMPGTPPADWRQWPQGSVKRLLAPVMGPRLLERLSGLSGESTVQNVLNEDEKTVCRVASERWRRGDESGTENPPPLTLRVFPMRGWEDETVVVTRRLKKQGFRRVKVDSFGRSLEGSGRVPLDYPRPYPPAFDARHSSIHDVSVKVLSHLLVDLKLNTPGACAGEDIEYLHDYRVAMRRMRSLLAVTSGVFDSGETGFLADELKQLGRLTGENRDFDVFHLELIDSAGSLGLDDEAHINELIAYVSDRRKQSGRQFADHIASAEYREFLQRFESFLSNPKPGSKADMPVRKFADAQIWRLYRQIRKAGLRINKHSDDEQLHWLRRRGKRLRYAIEFFSSAYPSRKLKLCQGYLKKLQNVLGDFQDQCVQIEHLELIASVASELGLDQGRIEEHVAQRRRNKKQLRKKFQALFAEFSDKAHYKAYESLFKRGKKR